ncbi:MAG: NADH-quinone oxidoreductase subunit H [Candidatus Omnitrophica bacterium]|nr:NADH-quinone oxidoreductase subunit H [Candidatus Omnitrophota bacterium]
METLLIALVFSPLLPGIIARTKAVFAGRRGAPLLQFYYDIHKSLRKGRVTSDTVTWIFSAAPSVLMLAAVFSSFLAPFGRLKAPVQFTGDMIFLVYLYGLARFFMLLAAWDTGSSFEGMGAGREAFFSCLAEITLFADFLILAKLSKSLSLSEMIQQSSALSWRQAGPALMMVVVSYFAVLLAENSRIPVDDPATHLELTMIHEVMALDHSGPDLGWIVYAGAMKLFVLGALLVSILIPFGTGSLFFDRALFLAGMAALGVAIGVVESVMARFRLDRVPSFLVGSFVFAVFGLIITFARGV